MHVEGARECGKTASVARRDGSELDRVLMQPDRDFWDTKVSSSLGASHQAPSQKSAEGGTRPKKHAPDNQKHDPVPAPERYLRESTRGAVHQSYLFGCRCRIYLMAIKNVTPGNFQGISCSSLQWTLSPKADIQTIYSGATKTRSVTCKTLPALAA